MVQPAISAPFPPLLSPAPPLPLSLSGFLHHVLFLAPLLMLSVTYLPLTVPPPSFGPLYRLPAWLPASLAARLPPCPPVCRSGFRLSVFHQRRKICCYTHSQAGPTRTARLDVASSGTMKLSLQWTSQSNGSRSSAEEGQRYVPMASAASPAAGDQMRLGNSSRCVPMNPWTPPPLPPCVSCPFSSPEHVCFYTCQQLESGLGHSAAARPTPAARGGRGRWHG